MTNNDFFKFEKNGIDFPFYNKYFPINNIKLIILLVAFILPIFIMFGRVNVFHFGIFLLILGILAIGFAANWDFSSIYKKVHLSDFKIIILMIIAQAIFALFVSITEFSMGFKISNNHIFHSGNPAMQIFLLLFGLMGEELYKLCGFFAFSYIFYKITKNRKISISIAVILTLLIFGALHTIQYQNLFHSIVAIGIASIFTMFCYLKTKNAWVSYICHVIYDLLFISSGFLLTF